MDKTRTNNIIAIVGLIETHIEVITSKERATKQKSIVDVPSNEVVEIEVKLKKCKGDEPLTNLQQCMTMSAIDIEKLDKSK